MTVKFRFIADENYINSFNYRSASNRENRSHHTTLLDVPVVGIDGEGYNDPEKDHHYDIIAAAGKDWTDHKLAEIELKPEEIFEFLLSLPEKYGKALYFIYGGSYDFNMWIKRFGDRALERLIIAGRCKYQHYKISWKPKREIIITDLLSLECKINDKGKHKGRHKHTYTRQIHIYDVIGFFQM